MNIHKFYLYAACSLAFSACSDDIKENKDPENPDVPTASVEKEVTIDTRKTYQKIVGFGASDCWTPAYVGKYWTSNRDKISELLFSSDIVDGQPKGIGLSMWRVNLGGGTMEQGDQSGLVDKSRRADSYLNAEGIMDWNRCEGQRYFMRRAKDMGCNNFVLFSNTPLVQYTINGKGFSQNGSKANLKADCYDDYARYMASVACHYTDEGYFISHISPVNEPQYNWDGNNQEGSGWRNDEIAKLVRELDRELTSESLKTDILVGEAGNWEYLYQVKGEAARSNVIENFFSPESSNYIGDLPHVKKLVCGHSYWTDGTWEGMRKVRENVAKAASAYGIEVWQSEWSMLGDGYSSSEFVGFDKASHMDIALYMSKVINNDLTVANVTSWSYWVSMDVPRWGHKNRFLLISLTPGGWTEDKENVDCIDKEGDFQATSTLWVLGNYSRFIRPGYTRVSLDMNESRSFFGSAWLSPEKDKLVVVYTNLSKKGVRLAVTHEGWEGEVQSVSTYTTTSSKNLKENKISNDKDVILDAESVTTVVYTLK